MEAADEKKESEKKVEEKKEDKKKEPSKMADAPKKGDEKAEESKKVIAKKDDENDKKKKSHVVINVESLDFAASCQCQKMFEVKNSHEKTVIFKIKTSDNMVYSVNPVFGKLETGKAVTVTVTHKPSSAKEGKLVVVNSVAPVENNDLAKTFKGIKCTGEDITIKLIAK